MENFVILCCYFPPIIKKKNEEFIDTKGKTDIVQPQYILGDYEITLPLHVHTQNWESITTGVISKVVLTDANYRPIALYCTLLYHISGILCFFTS